MANKRLNIRGGLNIKASLSSGAGDPVLTRDISTTEVGTIPPVDTSGYISTALNSAQLIVGNSSNIAQARDITGDVFFSNTGITTIQNGVIFNQHIANAAGILYSKLNLTGGIINSDISSGAAIDRTKIANGNPNRILINNGAGLMTDNPAITADRVLISNSNGLPIASGTTTTVLGYLDISSSLTQLLINKLSFSGAINANEGDIIQYVGGSWVNLGIGSSGTVLTSNGINAAWSTGVSNGLPTGGTANQYLRKIDGANYNTTWDTLTVSKITDLTASAIELNIMDGVTATTTQINYLVGTSSNIQTQINNKLNRALAYNAIFVGDGSNNAVELAPGSPDQVLTMVGAVPQWQDPTPPGNVSGVAPSTDNAIVRWNGTSADSIQNSGITIDDTDNVTGVTSLSSGQIDVLNQAALRLHETGSTNYVGIRASGTMAADYMITLPDTAPASNTYLKYDGANYVWDVAGGGGAVSSVNGTTDRISVSPTTGATVVDIAATYVGQASITTLGTITSGIWNGTSISTTYTDAKVATVAGTTNRISISGTATDPIINISSLYAGQVTITTLGTVTTGTWNANVVGAVYGGTGQSTVTTGDLLYGSASNVWSKLAGVATGNVLISGGIATAPSWGKVTASHVQSNDFWLVGGNALSGSGSIGSTSAQDVQVLANNVARATFLSNGKISFSGAYNTAVGTDATIVNTATATSTTSSTNTVGMYFDSSVTAGANSQTLIPFLFKGSLVQGSFTGVTGVLMRVQNTAGTTVFTMFDSGSIQTSTSLNTDDAYIFSAAGTGLLRLNSPSSLSFGNNNGIKFGRMNDNFTFSSTGTSMGAISTVAITNLNYAFHNSGSWNGATTTSKHLSLRYNWTPTSGSNSVTGIIIDNTINQTGTANGTVYGIDYNPTITSLNGASHYAALFRSGLVGIGTGTPTSTLTVVGNTLLNSNLKVGSTTDYIEVDQSAGSIQKVGPTNTPFFILGDNYTSGDGGPIIIQSGSGNAGNLPGEIRLIPGNIGLPGARLLLGFNVIQLGQTVDTTLSVAVAPASGNVTTNSGQSINIAAGEAYTISGNGNGGTLTLQSGAKRAGGSGVDGNITLDALTGYLILANLPTSSAGLPTGAVWRNGTVLNII